jgi:hypothetical protein
MVLLPPPSFIIIAITAISLAECTRLLAHHKRFLINDQINWMIDMRQEYPLGIVCQQLNIYLSKSIGGDSAVYLNTFSVPASEIIDSNGDEELVPDYLVGNRYIYRLPVDRLSAAVNRQVAENEEDLYLTGFTSLTAQLVLVCQLDQQLSGASNNNNQTEVLLAQSEPFEFEVFSAASSENGDQLTDISEMTNIEQWKCPISCAIPQDQDAILVNGQVMSGRQLINRWQNDDHLEVADAFNRPVDSISRIDPRLVRTQSQNARLCRSIASRLDVSMDQIAADASHKQAAAESDQNLQTAFVDADAIPITRQIWSFETIKRLMQDESSPFAVHAEMERLFGHQLSALHQQIQQARRRPSLGHLLAAGLRKSLKTFTLIALNLMRINRFGMLSVERQLVHNSGQVLALSMIVGWLFKRAGLDLLDAEFQGLLMAEKQRLQCQQLRLAAGLSFGPMLPVNAMLAAMDLQMSRRSVLKSLLQIEESLNQVATDSAINRAAIHSLSTALLENDMRQSQ